MASKIVGSIVATHIPTRLKVVLHVHKDGGTVTFTRPDVPDWNHQCHSSHERNPEGWKKEVAIINSPTFKEVEFYPV